MVLIVERIYQEAFQKMSVDIQLLQTNITNLITGVTRTTLQEVATGGLLERQQKIKKLIIVSRAIDYVPVIYIY